MKSPVPRIIDVWADWGAPGMPTRIGTLSVTPARSKEIFSFAYDLAWLKCGDTNSLDPSLRLFSGPQYPSAGKTNFGMFLDSAPRAPLDRQVSQSRRHTRLGCVGTPRASTCRQSGAYRLRRGDTFLQHPAPYFPYKALRYKALRYKALRYKALR